MRAARQIRMKIAMRADAHLPHPRALLLSCTQRASPSSDGRRSPRTRSRSADRECCSATKTSRLWARSGAERPPRTSQGPRGPAGGLGEVRCDRLARSPLPCNPEEVSAMNRECRTRPPRRPCCRARLIRSPRLGSANWQDASGGVRKQQNPCVRGFRSAAASSRSPARPRSGSRRRGAGGDLRAPELEPGAGARHRPGAAEAGSEPTGRSRCGADEAESEAPGAAQARGVAASAQQEDAPGRCARRRSAVTRRQARPAPPGKRASALPRTRAMPLRVSAETASRAVQRARRNGRSAPRPRGGAISRPLTRTPSKRATAPRRSSVPRSSGNRTRVSRTASGRRRAAAVARAATIRRSTLAVYGTPRVVTMRSVTGTVRGGPS